MCEMNDDGKTFGENVLVPNENMFDTSDEVVRALGNVSRRAHNVVTNEYF